MTLAVVCAQTWSAVRWWEGWGQAWSGAAASSARRWDCRVRALVPLGPTELVGRRRDRAETRCPVGQSPGAARASYRAGQSVSAHGAGRPIRAEKGRDEQPWRSGPRVAMDTAPEYSAPAAGEGGVRGEPERAGSGAFTVSRAGGGAGARAANRRRGGGARARRGTELGADGGPVMVAGQRAAAMATVMAATAAERAVLVRRAGGAGWGGGRRARAADCGPVPAGGGVSLAIA